MDFYSFEGSVACDITAAVQSGKWGNSLIPIFGRPDLRAFPPQRDAVRTDKRMAWARGTQRADLRLSRLVRLTAG